MVAAACAQSARSRGATTVMHTFPECADADAAMRSASCDTRFERVAASRPTTTTVRPTAFCNARAHFTACSTVSVSHMIVSCARAGDEDDKEEEEEEEEEDKGDSKRSSSLPLLLLAPLLMMALLPLTSGDNCGLLLLLVVSVLCECCSASSPGRAARSLPSSSDSLLLSSLLSSSPLPASNPVSLRSLLLLPLLLPLPLPSLSPVRVPTAPASSSPHGPHAPVCLSPVPSRASRMTTAAQRGSSRSTPTRSPMTCTWSDDDVLPVASGCEPGGGGAPAEVGFAPLSTPAGSCSARAASILDHACDSVLSSYPSATTARPSARRCRAWLSPPACARSEAQEVAISAAQRTKRPNASPRDAA